MKFISILNRDGERKDIPEEEPAFFVDLNLNRLIDEFQNRSNEYDVKKLFLVFPNTMEDIRYRREVLTDLKNDSLFESVRSFSKNMYQARSYFSYSEVVDLQIQKEMWALNGAVYYLEAWEGLLAAFHKNEVQSEGLLMLSAYMREIEKKDTFKQWKSETATVRDLFQNIQLEFTLSRGQLSIALREDHSTNYNDCLKKLFPDRWKEEDEGSYYMESPFHNKLELSLLEREILDMMQKVIPDRFKAMHRFWGHAKDVLDDILVRFEEEVQFYLCYLDFHKEMEDYGFHFTKPVVVDERELKVNGVYDLSLAFKGAKKGRQVVSNDVYFQAGERFFVVTGPNQGGKTTFARSMGQLMYFAMMGLEVPAKMAIVPYVDGIMTHFSVEESVETGRGKLKEELTRLAPMMHGTEKNQFVILNELFTTAATYDSYIMGENVMGHFIKNNCMGIYVTHIRELAEGNDAIVSLVATASKSDYHKRTYRIVRKDAEGMGYAGDMAERFHLTYPLLKERLKENSLHSRRG